MVYPQYQVLELKPGINKNNTPYGTEGGYVDCDKIRFRDSKPRKIGGWERQTQDTFLGTARDILSWNDLDGNKYVAIASNKQVDIYLGGQYYDITPIRSTVAAPSAITCSAGNTTVNVTVSSHACLADDSVEISSAVTVAGNVYLNGTYTITSVVDANTFTIDYGVTVANTTTAAGLLDVHLLLQNGYEYNQQSFGYSSGSYGTSAYGDPRTISSLTNEMRQWSLENWGEDLLACNYKGAIYHWDETSGVGQRMLPLANAPSQNNFIKLSYPTRHLITLGCTSESSVYDPMLVRWSSAESLTDWNASAGNTAGSQRMEHGNRLLSAESSKTDILLFSDTATYNMRYVGQPFVFGFDLIGEESGIISQHAAQNVDGVVYWMGLNAFYRYDGSLRTLDCTVREAVFGKTTGIGLEPFQKEMVFCGINPEFNEIIWFYPTIGSTKCDRYVIYNYIENLWYDGSMDRCVWEGPNVYDKPLGISRDSVLYAHEQGYNDDASPMESYITSAMFDLNNGEEVMFMDKFIPDFNQTGNLSLEVTTRKYPSSTETQVKTYTVGSTSGKINTRARGRQASIKITSNETNGNFIVGRPRLAMKPDGRR